MKFYILPAPANCYVAMNAKCASSSLAAGIANAFYPGIQYDYKSPLVRFMIPTAPTPDAPVHVVIREPVDRFISCIGALHIRDIDALLTELEAGGPMSRDEHLLPQLPLTQTEQPTKTYIFPVGLQQLCADVGIAWPLPDVEHLPYIKPTLTDEQIARVQTYYANDIALYASLGVI